MIERLNPQRLMKLPKLIRKKSKKPGSHPGIIEYTGEKKVDEAQITLIDYDKKGVREKKVKNVEDCFPFRSTPTVTWINIDGLHDVEIIKKLGKHFGLHPLVLEDIVSTDQRPKMEEFKDYIFLVLRMVQYDDANGSQSEQVSIILGKNFVIYFQETHGDVFDPIRERLRDTKRSIREKGPDYLAYALNDAIVDNYFYIFEKIGDEIENLEEEVMLDPKPETLQKIYALKRELISLRKSIWPLREVVNKMERYEASLITAETKIYLRDVYDHTIQVIDTVETFRDMASGLLDIYLSSISNKMNEVMKVLTIAASIFIPLTFIAGVYGMNFQYMPELAWKYGYFAALCAMAIVGFGMAYYFKRKKWL